MTWTFLGLFLLLFTPGPASPAEPTPPVPQGEIVRGITISTHTDGREWGSERMRETMQDIRALGADWVAIHPYAGIRADGSVRFWRLDAEEPPGYIARPIRIAHQLGLKILIKPHLAYWGSPFRWRGEIGFREPEPRERFWRGYEQWIVELAAAARDADGFVVGTELDRTLGHEREWRRLIRRVRETTRAPLTYAANWTDFERVPFWDALDAIGIQAYFPLTHNADADEEEIREGWKALMGRLNTFARRQGRPIVFTELGYNRSHQAPVRPWAHRTDGREAEVIQARCMKLALEAIDREPSVVGAFLWKWFPEPHPVGRNFQLATTLMKSIIREAWRE